MSHPSPAAVDKNIGRFEFSPRKRLWAYFLLLTVTFGYFYHGGGFNQNSVLGEIRELVENHRFDISTWLPITGDVSFYKDKVLSNKSPSMLFFVAPVYALVHVILSALQPIFGFDLQSTSYQMFVTHFLTFLCSGLWAAFTGVLLLQLISKIYPTLTDTDSYKLSYLFIMGTFTLPYSGSAMIVNFESFWALAVLFGLISYLQTPTKRQYSLLALSCGFLVLANQITVLAIPAVLLSIKNHLKQDFWKKIIHFGILATCPLLPLFVYNQINFDFFLSSNRTHMSPAWTDPNLFLGVFDRPHFSRIYQVFGPGIRSLLTSVPFIFLAILGCSRRIFGPHAFPLKYVPFIASMFFIFFMFLLTFNGWHGGSCFGPRYFLIVVPLLAVMTGPFYIHYRNGFYFLLAWSLLLMVIVASKGIWFDEISSPLKILFFEIPRQPSFVWPAFIGQNPPFNNYNLGDLLGLKGYWSLLPLVLLHAAILPKIFGFSFKILPKPQTTSVRRFSNFITWSASLILIALIFSRAFSHELSPFINDEPHIQLRINQFFAGGPLPLVGLSGSQPIPYGPIPTWIYVGLRLLSDSYQSIMLGHTFTHIAALFLLWYLLRKISSPGRALITMTLVASSPFLYNYSRMTWDNTFLFLFSIMIVLATYNIFSKEVNSKYTRLWWIILGLFSGLAVGTHLMVFPLLLATGIMLFFYEYKSKTTSSWFQLCKKPLLALSAFLLVLGPYIFAVSHQLGSRNSQPHWGGVNHIHSILERFIGALSLYGFSDYFFNGDLEEFKHFLPLIIRRIQLFDISWLIKAPVFLMLLWAIYRIFIGKFTKKAPELPPILLYAAITFASTLLFYVYTGHFSHPHYYHYIWWIPPVTLTYLMSTNWSFLGKFILTGVGFTTLANLVFVYHTQKYIAFNEGTRGFGWGATAKNQKRLLAEVCQDAGSKGLSNVTLDISQVVILPASLEFFALKEPKCKDLPIKFENQGRYRIVYEQKSPNEPRSRLTYITASKS